MYDDSESCWNAQIECWTFRSVTRAWFHIITKPTKIGFSRKHWFSKSPESYSLDTVRSLNGYNVSGWTNVDYRKWNNDRNRGFTEVAAPFWRVGPGVGPEVPLLWKVCQFFEYTCGESCIHHKCFRICLSKIVAVLTAAIAEMVTWFAWKCQLVKSHLCYLERTSFCTKTVDVSTLFTRVIKSFLC